MELSSEKQYLHFGPAPDFKNRRDRRLRRFFEILPGALLWLTFLGVGIVSFVRPAWAAFFIIAFDTYWVINATYFGTLIVGSAVKMRRAVQTDWMKKLHNLDPSTYSTPGLGSWRELVHLVVLPMYREGFEIVAPSLEALARSAYPKDRLWVVLATEKRAGEEAQETARALKERFVNRFGRFLVTVHPADVLGEIPGKGSNETYAAREALRQLIDPAAIPYEHVIVSSFDSDTRVLPGYFARLTHCFLTTDQPTRASYQPVPLFNNNIWEVPLFSRIPAIGSTVWQLFMQAQPHFQETFSSHSMSLRALVDIGFWNTRLVNEDSIIFWQCYLGFDGNYRTISLFYPISMDATVASTLRKTAVNIYKQHRRWAYGVEKVSYAFFGFFKNRKIPIRKKVVHGFRLIVGFWLWGSAPLLLMSLGWLPVVVGGEAFRSTVLALNLPRWTQSLMTIAAAGLVMNGALTFLLLPPRPKNRSRWIYASVFLQWLFLPLSTVLFGSIPAIDAQTRMMLGRYMGFWVTEKVRKRPHDGEKYEVPHFASGENRAEIHER